MISIAMATYNGEKYLREQLDSILAQTIQDFELVVCDDCSIDSSVQILKEYREKDSRIKVFINEKNLGYAKNFEKAIQFCNGEYIALSDHDDIWLPCHLEILLKNIEGKTLTCGNAILIDSEGKEWGTTLLDTIKIDFLPETNEDFLFFLLHGNFFQGAAMLFKRELIKKALPIPNTVKGHDHWLALFACKEGGVSYSREPVLKYRIHQNNTTHNEKFSVKHKIFKFLFKNKNTREAIYQRRLDVKNIIENFSHYYSSKEIDNAMKYHNNLVKRKPLKILPYFLSNRRRLVLSDNKRLLFVKLVKLFV